MRCETQREAMNLSTTATQPLLLEIGCEEIPARFLSQAQQELEDRLREALEQARLLWSGGNGTLVQTFSTPRRLVAHASAILDRQPDKSEEVVGPPIKVAYDAEGKPTRAAESFAQKNTAQVGDLTRVSTPKGEYLALKKTVYGKAALNVLSEILPSVITGITFPKSMYWEKSKTRFVRPIRWIVALVGEGESSRVVPFQVAGVRTGNETYGHRLAANGALAVSGFKDYVQKLRNAYVEFDPENRRQAIESEFNILLEDWLEAIPDPDLESWIVNSNEWISGIRGEFDSGFLHLPREILITVMRDHQKYFAVQDQQRRLRPHFIAMLGRDRDATGTIRAGHERVLTARFSDAEFFWKADQKIPLRDRVPMLDRVTYQAKLGSYGDKVRRMQAIAKAICGELHCAGELESLALRAVTLSKCDLPTQMVQEFTELQGIVGGLYAREQGEPAPIADAIYDQYLPQSAEDACPRGVVGAIVSLTDKLDTVIAGFKVGLEPTGSSDPFALRRAGNGIVRLAIESLAGLSLATLLDSIDKGLCAVGGDWQALSGRGELRQKVDNFLRERMEFYLQEAGGIRYDTVRSVLKSRSALQDFIPSEALSQAKALEQVRDSEDFLALAAAAKRTRNIRKSAGADDLLSGEPDPANFKEAPERELYAAYQGLSQQIERLSSSGRYEEALRAMATIRPLVDRFFDNVLVMTEDVGLRRNRLKLLMRLNEEVFTSLADLAEIAGEGRAV